MRQMMPDNRHRQIGAIFPAKFFRDSKAVMSGLVRHLPHFGKQCPPISTRMAVIIPIGPRIFAAMIKKTDIVVARFNRFDLPINERVEFGQIVGDLCGNFEEH